MMSTYKVLSLWPEKMQRTSINAMIGELAEVKEMTIGGKRMGLADTSGSLFILLLDCALSSYLRDQPQNFKTLDLEEFFEGSANMKGQTYTTYLHKDYLVAEAKFRGNYYNFNSEDDENNLFMSFAINLKKNNFRTIGKPEDCEIDSISIGISFDNIINILYELRDTEPEGFETDKNGMFSIRVGVLMGTFKTKLLHLSSFGFGFDELIEIITDMRDRVS